MQTFTLSTLGIDRENKMMELINNQKAICFTHAAEIVLSKEFNVPYFCYGGTPVMPIAEFRPMIQSKGEIK